MWQALQSLWHRRDFLRRIRRFGWTGTHVPGDDGVPFAYSIGFWDDVGSPEVFMFGFPIESANGLIGEAHRQIEAGDLKLVDKAPWHIEWEDGPQLAWREVHPSQIRREYFNVAIWYRERRGLPREGLRAFQLFVGDRNGLFPWEEGYDLDYKPVQRELYLPYAGPVEDD